MTNNEVLRTLRYALELDNTTLIAVLALADVELAPRRLAGFLKADEEDGFEPLSDELLGLFLDGFIAKYRGKREASATEVPAAPPPLTNNRVLRSLRIALELKDVDLIAIIGLGGVTVSKAELGALFRREDHRNYQPCGDQFLRNFVRGLGVWHRTGRPRA